jgi:hypothetical protein
METQFSLWSYGAKQKKTFSQNVARFFELVGYMVLIPTTVLVGIALFCCLCYGLIFLLSAHFVTFVYMAISLLFSLTPYFFGCVLLRGYFLHSRGRLKENKVMLLWIGTIAYNIMPLAFIVLVARKFALSVKLMSVDFWMQPFNRVLVFICIWFVTVCALSVVCICDDYSLKNSDSVS